MIVFCFFFATRIQSPFPNVNRSDTNSSMVLWKRYTPQHGIYSTQRGDSW